MIVNIFNDIWNQLVKFSDDSYQFIMNHYEDPFLWITIFVVLLLVGYKAISSFGSN